jgi:hypothetical protein
MCISEFLLSEEGFKLGCHNDWALFAMAELADEPARAAVEVLFSPDGEASDIFVSQVPLAA